MSTSSSDSRDNDAAALVIGNPATGYLAVRPRRRSHPHCDDYWDGNWVDCAIEVHAGAFRGSVNADLRAEEFVAFRKASTFRSAVTGAPNPSGRRVRYLRQRAAVRLECRALDRFMEKGVA